MIVLYEMRPDESRAFKSLTAALSSLHASLAEIKILLHDNTPGQLEIWPLPPGVEYESGGHNSLSAAYNSALRRAGDLDFSWLLILDQDTLIPPEYLPQMLAQVRSSNEDSSIAAIVPHVFDGNRPVAPVIIRPWGVSFLPSEFSGTSEREIHSTNSATFFRTSALRMIGGFSPYFWLDYVDGYVFHRLHLHQLKVFIAPEVRVEHNLSLLHGSALKAGRYRNILQAESAFWDLYGGTIQRIALTIRLVCRVWRQKRRGHALDIRMQSWSEAVRRILHSKSWRISSWIREMDSRIRNSSQSKEHEDLLAISPRISVCMATHNGERYIRAQLDSILCQLRQQDEVIVVDDASTDGTRDCVRSFNDARIRLIEHSSNQGVARTFEDAIRSASGEILFLSDQDDVWMLDKVATTLRLFQLYPTIDLVVSDAELIDENDGPLTPAYYANRSFNSGLIANIIHCRYLGCTMAFRKQLSDRVLPFPKGGDVFHDLWIGAANTLTRGKTLYINRPLVRYRRHSNNATGNTRLHIGHQFRIRWKLCLSLAMLTLGRHQKTERSCLRDVV